MIGRSDSLRTVDAEIARTSARRLMHDERPSDLWATARDSYGPLHRVVFGNYPDGTPTSRLSCCGYRRAFGGVERDPSSGNRCRRCLRRKEAR